MIAVVGLDHHRASVEARGRLAFSDARLIEAITALHANQWIDEVVVLSTCNRTEVYLASQRPDEGLRAAQHYLESTYNRVTTPHGGANTTLTQQTELATALYSHEGPAVVSHLYEVAAGLRSMVIGEPQILGQVRAALTTAEAERAVGEELRSLLTGALKIGKRVRSETEINRADVSVSGLGVRVAREALGSLQGKTALVIGAGRTSHLSAQLLRAEGVSKLIIANRSLASAQALAEQVGGEAISLDDCATAIAQADAIFSATAAPATVLTEATVALGRANRSAPLMVVDLAVPADIEAGVGALPGVTLHTLDSLRDMADPDAHNDPAVLSSLQGRERDIAQAYLIIEEGLRDFAREQTLRMAAPGIAALRRHVDLSQEQELARALTQLTHLSDADRAIIERFGARLVDKMFHHLVRRIRTLAEYDEIPPEVTMRVLAQLFAETPDRDTLR